MTKEPGQYITGLDLREGLLFAVILIVWLASIEALCVLGGAQ